MREKKVFLSFFISLAASFFISRLSLLASSQEAAKLAGDWQVVVKAEGQYYYLNLTLKEAEGKLEGTISEANGFFQDVFLTNIKLEADLLHFEFPAPTPPDGLTRQISADLKITADYEKMEGSFYIPDLGVVAKATATRQKS